MKTRLLFLVLFILVFMLLVTSCSSSSTSSANATPAATSNLDGAGLVQERCSICHSASVVSGRSHTQTEWKSIVDQMIQRGAQLTPDEESKVISYLATNYGK
jgi:cytochrome c-type biogenesis protein CcmH/NrfF